MKYRKKPVEVEAIQWILGFNDDEVSEFCEGKCEWIGEGCSDCDKAFNSFPQIKTLEGTMTANPGDFVIKGVRGEFYPCKPDIFAETYEPVEAD